MSNAVCGSCTHTFHMWVTKEHHRAPKLRTNTAHPTPRVHGARLASLACPRAAPAQGSGEFELSQLIPALWKASKIITSARVNGNTPNGL